MLSLSGGRGMSGFQDKYLGDTNIQNTAIKNIYVEPLQILVLIFLILINS
jgi:hypothetical protein